MRRMGNLSRHLGWLLLAPEPREDQRGRGSMWMYLAFGAFFALLGVTGLFLSPPQLEDALQQWALALLFLVQGFLYAPVVHERPRAVLGLRVALSVVALAVMGIFALAFFSRGFWFGVALVAAFLVVVPCSNYFANRRKYRRSRPA